MSRMHEPEETSELLPGPDTAESHFLIPATDSALVQYGAATHQGKVRTRNEDHYAVVRRKRSRDILATNVDLDEMELPQDEAYSLIVADGAGGEGFGHLASQLAVRTVWETAGRAASWLDETLGRRCRRDYRPCDRIRQTDSASLFGSH